MNLSVLSGVRRAPSNEPFEGVDSFDVLSDMNYISKNDSEVHPGFRLRFAPANEPFEGVDSFDVLLDKNEFAKNYSGFSSWISVPIFGLLFFWNGYSS